MPEKIVLFLPSEPAVGNFAFLCSVLYETISATNALILLSEAISGGGGRGGCVGCVWGDKTEENCFEQLPHQLSVLPLLFVFDSFFCPPFPVQSLLIKRKWVLKTQLLPYLLSFLCLLIVAFGFCQAELSAQRLNVS